MKSHVDEVMPNQWTFISDSNFFSQSSSSSNHMLPQYPHPFQVCPLSHTFQPYIRFKLNLPPQNMLIRITSWTSLAMETNIFNRNEQYAIKMEVRK